MNGLTPEQVEQLEALEGALFILRAGKLRTDNAKLYIQIGDGERVLREVEDIEKRQARAADLVSRAITNLKAARDKKQRKR